MKHIFIVNPVAGKFNQTKIIAHRVNEIFLNNVIEGTYRIETTKGVGDATLIARKYAETNEEICLYACGGDGTLNEVLNGCYGYANVHLAIIPIGTGNDFVKSFGLGAESHFLDLDQMLHAKTRVIDVLEVNGRYSLNIINAGLDANIAKNVTKFRRLPFINGAGAYNLSLVYCFFTSMKNQFRFMIDGKLQQDFDYTFSVMANGQFYGGSYQAAPLSDMQDGFIDIVLIPTIARRKILKLIGVYKRGEHLQEEYQDIVHYMRGNRIEILSKKPVTICIDGEIAQFEKPIITIHPSAVKILIPESCMPETR